MENQVYVARIARASGGARCGSGERVGGIPGFEEVMQWVFEQLARRAEDNSVDHTWRL